MVSWAMAEYSRSGLPVLIRGDRQADFGVAIELLAALPRGITKSVLATLFISSMLTLLL